MFSKVSPLVEYEMSILKTNSSLIYMQSSIDQESGGITIHEYYCVTQHYLMDKYV
jgi:hypothetical protein